MRFGGAEKGPSSANQDLIGVGLEGQAFLHPAQLDID
jgi:hypothetical protein